MPALPVSITSKQRIDIVECLFITMIPPPPSSTVENSHLPEDPIEAGHQEHAQERDVQKDKKQE
jgi:hypothetical protein